MELANVLSFLVWTNQNLGAHSAVVGVKLVALHSDNRSGLGL